MKKILNIAFKDILVTLSDPAALILTIATPIALTLVMIFAFGGVNETGISGIPVVIVNLTEGNLGKSLIDVFKSQELAELVDPSLMNDPTAARRAVDNQEFAAAVIIPANFGKGLFPGDIRTNSSMDHLVSSGEISDLNTAREQAVVEIYGDPTRPIGVSIVQIIVDEFINRATGLFSGIQVSFGQMLKAGILTPSQAEAAIMNVGEFASNKTIDKRFITVQGSLSEDSTDADFDWFGYIAPSMALLFLMFTVSNGGRSILAENEGGTLPRMLISPSHAWQVLGGKVFGIYLNGVVQLAVLFIASLFMLQINWGPASLVIPTILFVVAAATGWGMLIAAFAKTSSQASILGTAITLIFAIGSGSFFPRQYLPEWLQSLSLLSPNAWGIEAFNSIRVGTRGTELLPLWVGMLTMFGILFTISIFVFRRRYQ